MVTVTVLTQTRTDLIVWKASIDRPDSAVQLHVSKQIRKGCRECWHMITYGSGQIHIFIMTYEDETN